MNTTNQNARLQRIQTASRFLKRVVWAYICLIVCGLLLVCLQGIAGFPAIVITRSGLFSTIPIIDMLGMLTVTVLTVFGAVTFYRLLSLYERGVIFAPANAAQFHRLGLVAIAFGVVQICSNILKIGGLNLLDIVTSPWIYGGIFLMIVAWIMEEGSKIQEEQALTV